MGRGSLPDDTNWLVHHEGGSAMLPVSARMVTDDDRWRAVIERLDVSDGMRVYLTRAVVHRPLTVQAEQLDNDSWLMAMMSVRGRLGIRFPDGVAIEVGPERAAFFRPARGGTALTPFPGRSLRMVGYMLRADRMHSMFGEAIPPLLRPMIDGAPGRSWVAPAEMEPAIRRLAAALFTNPLRGPLRPLFIEGVVLQFLAMNIASADRMSARIADSAVARSERLRLEQARDMLLADMRNPPGISHLAALTGMSEVALNAGFRSLFGGTVYEVLRDRRLDHARIVLESTDLPVKQVAHGVGYNHVTNFINAFTRRYGAPPRRYARARDDGRREAGSSAGDSP